MCKTLLKLLKGSVLCTIGRFEKTGSFPYGSGLDAEQALVAISKMMGVSSKHVHCAAHAVAHTSTAAHGAVIKL